MGALESAILKELTGSEQIGQYPDTLVDRLWDDWAFLSRLCEAQGRSVTPLGSTSSGGPRPPAASPTASSEALAQLTGSPVPGDAPGWAPSTESARARWDKRYRTAGQLVRECSAMIGALGGQVPQPGQSVPPPPPVDYPAPKNLTAVLGPDGSIALDWDDVADVKAYRLFETNSPHGVPGGDLTVSQSKRGPFNETRKFTYWVCSVFDDKLSAPSVSVSVEVKAPAAPPKPLLPAGTDKGTLGWASNLAGTLIKSGNFKSTPWNTENGGSWPPPVVDAPGGRGGKAIRFRLPDHGKRIEVEPDHRTFGAQGSAWFGFACYFDDDYPLSANSWQVIWQLHGNDTTSPRFALQARNNQLRVGDNQALMSLVKKTWYNIVAFADFSNGSLRTWVNGVDRGIKNVGHSNPDYYLKVGYYHDSSLPGGTWYGTDWAYGTGYGAVDPTP